MSEHPNTDRLFYGTLSFGGSYRAQAFYDECRKLETEITDLRRQLEEARKDSKRLLEAAEIGLEFIEEELRRAKRDYCGYPCAYHDTEETLEFVRQAIDATQPDHFANVGKMVQTRSNEGGAR